MVLRKQLEKVRKHLALRKAPAKPRLAASAGKKVAPKSSGRAAHAFSAAVSLGSICCTARFLERHGIRKQKFPFDWLYGSARLVRHCIADNFRQFLSDSQFVIRRGKRGTGHKLYERMQLGTRSSIWPHHVLTKKVDKDSFKRAVKRFQTLLEDSGSRKLFVLVQNVTSQAMLDIIRHRGSTTLPLQKVPIPAGPSYEHGSLEEVRHLFRALREHSRGSFHLDVVNLIFPGVTTVGKRPVQKKVHGEAARDCTLAVHDLYCRGPNTGLFFKDNRDHAALERVLLRGRHFDITDVHDETTSHGMRDVQAVEQQKAAQGMKRKAAASSLPSSAAARKRARAGAQRLPAMKACATHRTDQKLTIDWENPKFPGSSAHKRYQRYRRAKTVGEFFKFGGATGDLAYDQKRGYIRLVR